MLPRHPTAPRTLTPPDRLVRFGGWLFRRRTLIPVPLALVLLLTPVDPQGVHGVLILAGVALVAAGEAVRLWSVRHIGVISRTRSDRLGPLVESGPFALVRNPLYLGNILLWAGFALSAALPWLAPAFLVLLGVEYHAIVRWEERLLAERRGAEYRQYTRRVPRWIPRLDRPGGPRPAPAYRWRETLFSERGTLIAIAVGYLLLWLKAQL